jgi:hypothetical protein
MAGGDTLMLLNGTYSDAAGTGHIDTQAASPSGDPPSGTMVINSTIIKALNPGNVTVNGRLNLGSITLKKSYIKIQDILFVDIDGVSGNELYNTSFLTIKACGFKGVLGVGTNDHIMDNDNNLIEDVWIWAAGQRIIAINYRSHFNVWRRVIVRGDGCGTAACAIGGGNPNVGFTVYDSSDISVQNMIILDRILLPTDEPYSDFACAQHTPTGYFFGRNEWLGIMSLRAPDSGFVCEPDVGATVNPTVKILNGVVWSPAGDGFNLARDGTNNLLENLTVISTGVAPPIGPGDGIRAAPELTTGTTRNSIVTGAGRYGVNSVYTPSYIDVFNSSLALTGPDPAMSGTTR